jgi:hypothetical protein
LHKHQAYISKVESSLGLFDQTPSPGHGICQRHLHRGEHGRSPAHAQHQPAALLLLARTQEQSMTALSRIRVCYRCRDLLHIHLTQASAVMGSNGRLRCCTHGWSSAYAQDGIAKIADTSVMNRIQILRLTSTKKNEQANAIATDESANADRTYRRHPGQSQPRAGS